MARPPLTGVSENLFRKQLDAALDYIEALGVPNGDKGDITVSGSTWTIDNGAVDAAKLAPNAVETAKILDGAVTFAKLAGAAVITSAETIASNNNNTTIPTSAAVDAHIPAKLNASGSAPIYACRAWVNFNGTGTVAIRASGNVSSITDNGVGDYTINFATAMPDNAYAPSLACTGEVNVQHGVGFIQSLAAGSFRFLFYSPANSANTVDKSVVGVSIFR